MAVRYDGGAIDAAPTFWMGSLTRDMVTRFDDFLETNPVDNGYQLIELSDSKTTITPPTAAGADERGGVVFA